MSNKLGDEPPPYGAPPHPPKPAYGGPSPYPQDQAVYASPGQQQPYYQPGPQMGYYNQGPQGQFPPGQGPYPPGQAGPYPLAGGYHPYGPPQARERQGPGLVEGLLAGLACCCCLDLLF